MRIKSPPIVPGFDFEVCLVLDDFGQFRVYREADENDANRETVILNIISGQYLNPSRVVAFNTAEGWSRDITEDTGQEIINRAARRAAPPSGGVFFARAGSAGGVLAAPLHFLRRNII